MKPETVRDVLRYALIMTLLMTIFVTGVNTMLVRASDTGIHWSVPVEQAAKIVIPVLGAELAGYIYLGKIIREAKEEEERLEKERKQAEYRAKREQQKANQGKKKNKKK